MRSVSAPPDAVPIIAGLQSQRREFARGLRPGGTKDWLLITTLGGLGYVRVGAQSHTLRRGNMLLFAPDSPQDYGYLDEDSDWLNIWVHVRPRPHWLPWLVWPQVAKGVMVLPVSEQIEAIEVDLRRMVDVAGQPIRLRHDLALNALERALILCDAVNPLQQQAAIDPRIRRVLAIIGEKLTAPLDIASLSQAAGLSRSRFSVLFRDQMNLTPQAYVELTRLARAAQLLELSGWTVGQIAQETGFADPYYFSTRFRAHYGMAPSQYRSRTLASAA